MFLDVIVIHSPATYFKFQLSHWTCLSTFPTFVLVFPRHTVSEHFLSSVLPVCTGVFHLASKPLLQPRFRCFRMAVCRLDSLEFGGCRFHRCYIDHLNTMWQAYHVLHTYGTLQVTKEGFLLGQSIEKACWRQIFCMLFCSTLVPLKILLNINTKVEFANKGSTEG
jgi:hypothetical protein